MGLTQKLDAVHSIFIRLKYTDEYGFGSCVTCGHKIKYKYTNLQCGHFIDRANTQFRWYEFNTYPQCEDCNVYKGGNLKIYREFLVEQHSGPFVEMMEFSRQTGFEEFYLWGVEWWYWEKETQNNPRIWNKAKELMRQ